MVVSVQKEQARTPASPGRHRSFFARNTISSAQQDAVEIGSNKGKPTRWGMGILNDPNTHEVPGSVLLLTGRRNEPLGLRNAPARISASSLPPQPLSPAQSHGSHRQQPTAPEGQKVTKDGAIILVPQPDDSHNDPLNWPSWKRDTALLSLGLYCMIGGGMTPILAAGFTNVAATYHTTTARVSLTTGLYMMGLGIGSVFASPTAILYGKRPVYLVGAIIFICTSVWCALSPSYASLCVARVFQGISISPVECLPSATIAEIFFLHERAYRIGIYTLLLLGGKNLVPLVSAAIIQSLSWRWVFWIVAIVGGFCGSLLFLFVPETFWDRTPRPKDRGTSRNASKLPFFGRHRQEPHHISALTNQDDSHNDAPTDKTVEQAPGWPALVTRPPRDLHVGFARDDGDDYVEKSNSQDDVPPVPSVGPLASSGTISQDVSSIKPPFPATHKYQDRVVPAGGVPPTPGLHHLNSPFYEDVEGNSYFNGIFDEQSVPRNSNGDTLSKPQRLPPPQRYTSGLKQRPRLTFTQQLKPWNGRLHNDKWLRVATRPFILFAYPAVLWSSVVYSCSIGWLIVLSESVAVVFRSPDTYNFSALSTGLIYISPFVGGVLGTAVAGKVSDIIVRVMSGRNGGLYEPEFRLVMAAPVAVTTVIGLMGFGWSAQVHDAWIVPTLFFGIISFGCSLGSTTAITFCVDSYRQYAGEALVTLNFSKNVFHGLVFSLFFTSWLEDDGSKMVFIWLGVIQLIFLTFTIPLYIFGKRARMWTVRRNFMEKF